MSRSFRIAMLLGGAGALALGGFVWLSQPAEGEDKPLNSNFVPGDPRTTEQLERERLGTLSADETLRKCDEWVAAFDWEFGQRIKDIKDSGETGTAVEQSIDKIQRRFSEGYEQLTKDSDSVKVLGRKALDAWIVYSTDKPWTIDKSQLSKIVSVPEGEGSPGALDPADESIQQLGQLASAATAAGSADPLIRSLEASFNNVTDYEAAAAVYAKLPEELTQAGYHPYFRVMLQRNRFQQALVFKAANSGKIGGELIEDVTALMEDMSARPDEIRFAWFILNGVSDQLRGSERADLYRALLLKEKTSPVLLHLFAGVMLHADAWKIRGEGFVSSIKEEDWKEFESLMSKSATHFRNAWLLRPDMPHAARAMVTIETESSSSTWTPRQWFELCCHAQKDFMPSYEAYRRSLLPRWGGSHEELLAFGQECAETRAFDTAIPLQLFECATVIAAETPEAASWEYPPVVKALNSFWKDFDEWLQTPVGETLAQNRKDWYLSMRAAVALRNGEFNEARGALDRSAWPPNPGPLTDLMVDAEFAASMAYALSEPDSEKLIENEKRFGKHLSPDVSSQDLSEAIEVLNQAGAKTTSDRSRYYFSARARQWDLLRQYQDGAWVELKFEQPLLSWAVLNGDWKVESESSLRMTNVRTRYGHLRAVPLIPFAPPYTVIAEVERLPGVDKQELVGIDVGPVSEQNYSDQPGGLAFVIGDQPRIAGTFAPSEHQQQWYYLDGLGEKAEMRLNIRLTSYEMFVNQELMPLLPVNEFRPNHQLSFGANQFMQDVGEIRIGNIRIRKLAFDAEPDDDSVQGRVDFYTRAVEHDSENLIYQLKLGQALNQQRRWEEAFQHLEIVHRLRPGFMYSPVQYAISCLGIGRDEEAAPLLKECLDTSPENAGYLNVTSWLYATAKTDGLRNGSESLRMSTELCEQSNYGVAELIITQAAAFAETGEFAMALTAIEKARTVAEPGDDEFLNRLAEAFKAEKPWRSGL